MVGSGDAGVRGKRRSLKRGQPDKGVKTDGEMKVKAEVHNNDDGSATKSRRDNAATKSSLGKTNNEAALEEKWRLLPHYLRIKGLVKQHIDSFDYFVNHELQNIVMAAGNNEIKCESDRNFFFRYDKVYVGKPNSDENMVTKSITPHACRLRDFTYSAPIYVDVTYRKGKTVTQQAKVAIGKLPVMLKSSKCVLHNKTESELAKLQECPHDPGGYFVVKGTERVILIQEQLAKNRIIVEIDSKGCLAASVTSSTHERKSRTSVFLKNGRFFLKHSTMSEDLPIVVVLRAMGIETDQEIVSLVGSEPEIQALMLLSIRDAASHGLATQAMALEWIATKMKMPRRGAPSSHPKITTLWTPDAATERGGISLSGISWKGASVLELLSNIVLAHVPVHKFDFREKSFYMAYMIRQLALGSMNREAYLDDKDYYGNKRLELAGSLLSLLFEDLFKRFNADLAKQADHYLAKKNHADVWDCIKHVRQDTITNGFIHAISTGNWTLRRFKMERAGVTQQLSRLSYMSAIGHMTRITSQFEKTRKVSGPRALQPSQWGVICPSDTPEGESCGLVKNLALLTHVTSDEDASHLAELCRTLGVVDVNIISGLQIHSPKNFVVILNGRILGVHGEPDKFVANLRGLRRRGVLGRYASVFVNRMKRVVMIACDGGRVCRPLIIVSAEGASLVTARHVKDLDEGVATFNSLVEDGLIEFIDVNESNDTLIALREEDICPGETTHMEIDPLTLLGVVAGLIPYPHHNQSPRNTYQCAMGKQAIGTIGMNQMERIDTLLYLMIYPQKPMVTTRTLDLIQFDNLPSGQNGIVAVMSYSGYDIEDAIVLNKASLDRGFGRCNVLRKYQTVRKKYANQTEDRVVPPPAYGAHSHKFRTIEIDGIAGVGEAVLPGSILVNKESPVNTTDMLKEPELVQYRSTPLRYKNPNKGIVDKVMLTESENGLKLIKMLLRDIRRPELGDKFSSRHGQKGVCGLIVNQEDLPFNDKGICPDLIMNPHGFPSRMTVGKMIELIAGKAGVLDGKRRKGTVFGGDKVADCSRVLVEHGYSYSGKDYLTSGITGETIEAYIFMGPVFYQKLKHMVMDKMHARARGPRAVLTRQPTEGRSRDGGLRLGEMERDCLIGYGGSGLLIERLMISSDAFTASVCMECGLLGRDEWCQNCRSSANLHDVKLPYACKLLFQELTAMNIVPRLRLEEA